MSLELTEDSPRGSGADRPRDKKYQIASICLSVSPSKIPVWEATPPDQPSGMTMPGLRDCGAMTKRLNQSNFRRSWEVMRSTPLKPWVSLPLKL